MCHSWCGEYQLDNLAQNAIKVLDWKSYLWEALDTWGHYASCLVILYLIGKLIYTLVSVIVTRRKGTSWATALRLNTFFLTEFRNNLVQTLNETERRAAVAPTHGIELEVKLILTSLTVMMIAWNILSYPCIRGILLYLGLFLIRVNSTLNTTGYQESVQPKP